MELAKADGVPALGRAAGGGTAPPPEAPAVQRRFCSLAPLLGVAAALAGPRGARARKMTDAELLERFQRSRNREGQSCKAPADPSHTLGSVRTLLVDLPGDYTWLDDGIKGSLAEYVGGISVVNTIREERVVAEKPNSRWAFCASVHGVKFNSLLDLGDVREIASRLSERQTDREGRPLATQVLSASRGSLGVAPADTIEYRVETAQGPLHFLTFSSVLDGRLYNVTAQVPESSWPELGDTTQAALASARLCNKVSKFFAGYAGG